MEPTGEGSRLSVVRPGTRVVFAPAARGPAMNGREGDPIETFTGGRFYPFDPRPSEVRLEDIAGSLAHTCRFGGHCQRFYSVAEHSLYVARELADHGERVQAYGLLHDAGEAYVGDIPRPVKSQLGEFEAVEYADLTGLDFERGSVATQVVLETEDRRRRVKVPNEHAGTVRQRIETAVLAFHDVASIEAFRAKHAEPETETGADGEPTDGTESGADSAEQSGTNGAGTDSDRGSADGRTAAPTDRSLPADQDPSSAVYRREASAETTSGTGSGTRNAAGDSDSASDRTDDIDALSRRVDALSEQVERQTELIENQQDLLEQLVDELRRGR